MTKRQILCCILIGVISSVSLGGCYYVSSNNEDYRLLHDVTYFPQETDTYCAAAVGQMLFQYYMDRNGYTLFPTYDFPTQEEIYERAAFEDDEDGKPTLQGFRDAYNWILKTQLNEDVGNDFFCYYTTYAAQEENYLIFITNMIQEDHPLLAYKDNENSQTGHVIMIAGYQDDGDDFDTVVYIYGYDPNSRITTDERTWEERDWLDGFKTQDNYYALIARAGYSGDSIIDYLDFTTDDIQVQDDDEDEDSSSSHHTIDSQTNTRSQGEK